MARVKDNKGATRTATNKKCNEKIATNDKKKQREESSVNSDEKQCDGKEASENSYEKKRASTATKKSNERKQ